MLAKLMGDREREICFKYENIFYNDQYNLCYHIMSQTIIYITKQKMYLQIKADITLRVTV